MYHTVLVNLLTCYNRFSVQGLPRGQGHRGKRSTKHHELMIISKFSVFSKLDKLAKCSRCPRSRLYQQDFRLPNKMYSTGLSVNNIKLLHNQKFFLTFKLSFTF